MRNLLREVYHARSTLRGVPASPVKLPLTNTRVYLASILQSYGFGQFNTKPYKLEIVIIIFMAGAMVLRPVYCP